MKFLNVVASYTSLLYIFSTQVLSKTIEVDWDITFVEANPDGLLKRRVIGVNNQFPLPRLEGTVGDTIIVNAKNSLDRPTSLHAHGLSFKNNVFSDGAVSVNNCGIPPGQNYTYTLELTEQGTYWFHSHSGGDYADGLRTPLIVHPTSETMYTKYDEDIILTLSDWYHEEAYTLGKFLTSSKNPAGYEPPPNSGMINDRDKNSFPVSKDTTYRLRLINTSTMAVFHVKVDGHEMSLIEIDGVDIKPVTLNSVELHPAQRASILITTKNSTDFNYLIHADMDPAYFDEVPDTLTMNITASLVYDQGSGQASIEDHTWDTINESELEPIIEEVYQAPDQEIVIVSDIMQLDDGAPHGLINGITYRMPKVPILLSMLTMGEDATNPLVYGPRSNAFVTGYNKTVRVVIENVHLDAHPFHLHGHKFQVVAAGEGSYVNADEIKPPSDDWNPVRRDTVLVPGEGHAVIQFVSNNPGAWPIHCHNNWHMMFGMMGVIVEAPLEAQRMIKYDPSQIESQCTLNGFKISGNAGGDTGLNLSNAPSSPTMINYGIHAKGIVAIVFCVIAALIGISSTIFFAKQLSDDTNFERRMLLQPE
ncbi:Iron transport multicopper oxidase fio1 [Smittium culicis]|uniref:Iron transport multicopper oxidase fio1 n=1 Tax=Smittium culicis TaxID=133412 RepID=A0A1R1Y9Q7_9FUNG|nr:Iron transport multicopper oxidase fio1 [Smittium culicis]OMJ29345.1 Iron transport multicopper oxidase fio1 [Smittium culicis]